MDWVVAIALSVLIVLIALDLHSIFAFRRHAAVEGSVFPSITVDHPTDLASVIVPCKGDDGRLLENLKTLLDQDYANAEFILVTALPEDPATAVFGHLIASYPNRKLKTIAAGISTYCAEKSHNCLKGAEASDPKAKILVFLDADAKADRQLIRKLITGLQKLDIVGTTGYRWYEPTWDRIPELIRTTWNAGGYSFLIDPKTSYLFGGAMAIRRDVFFKADIPTLWARTVSDDMTLSTRLRSLGLKTRFLADCLVLSREKDSWSSILRWINRQTFMLRHYHKTFFVICFIDYVFGNLVGWMLFAWGLASGLSGGGALARIALLAGSSWIAHYWLMGALMITPLVALTERLKSDLKSHRWAFTLVAPLTSWVQAVSCLCCLWSKRVSWAGVTYEVAEGQTMRLPPSEGAS